MPKITPQAARRDAWPPSGGLPGSDLDFMREQLLDLYDMDYGIMNPLSPTGQGDQNADFSAAMAFAANEAQLERWTVAREAAEGVGRGALRESAKPRPPRCKRRAGNKDFAQVFMLSRTGEAHGRRRYWPIYRGRGRGGPAGRHPCVRLLRAGPMTNSGWPSFYIEEMTEHATGQQAVVASMIFEGLFEQLPRPEGRADRIRLRLAAGARLAARQALGAHARRGPACEAPAVGIHPRAFLGLDPADGGGRGPRARDRRDALDRLRPHPVRERLSALGLRRSVRWRCRRA